LEEVTESFIPVASTTNSLYGMLSKASMKMTWRAQQKDTAERGAAKGNWEKQKNDKGMKNMGESGKREDKRKRE
jgi:hypothetical protein